MAVRRVNGKGMNEARPLSPGPTLDKGEPLAYVGGR
jgi:hypothetical protein